MTATPLFQWRHQILSNGLSPEARLVAMVLSVHMNSAGICASTTLERIATESARRRESILQSIAELKQAGYLSVTRGAGRSPNVYRAKVWPAFSQEHLFEAEAADRSSSRKTASSSRGPRSRSQENRSSPAPGPLPAAFPPGSTRNQDSKTSKTRREGRAYARGHPQKGPMGRDIRELIAYYEARAEEAEDGGRRGPQAGLPAPAGLADAGFG